MSERPVSPSRPATVPRTKTSWVAWSDRILLVVAAVALAFFVWNAVVHGIAAREAPAFQAWAQRIFLLMCAVLALSIFAEAAYAFSEGLERREPPPSTDSQSVRTRSFRMAGPAQSLLRHLTGQLDNHFRRFYAFHRYEAPYVTYLYFAKKGSLSLQSVLWAKAGFLLFFLVGYAYVDRQGFSGPQAWGWETAALGIGCLLVLAGLLVRLAVPYRKVWLQIVEENNRLCLTLSSLGRSKDRWFEALCESVESQDGVVSCSTQSR